MSFVPEGALVAAQLQWPLTYRFHISGPFGGSQLELCVDAPSLIDNLDASKRLAPLLWYGAIAPAMTQHVACDFVEMVAHTVGLIPSVFAPTGLQGVRFGSAAPSTSVGVLAALGGDTATAKAKRFYAAGMPASWTEDGMLSTEGAERLQELARTWIAGMGVDAGASDPQLLIRERFKPFGAMPGETIQLFRRVRFVIVCQHTARVPAAGNLDWP